jgi:hypothetical protein
MIMVMGPLRGQNALAQLHEVQGVASHKGQNRFRMPENDAINCFYLQLRVLGYTESYEKFREQIADDPKSLSLASLADLGRKFGFRLMAAKMDFAELARADTPVILYFEEGEIGQGRFHLFLGIYDNGRSVSLINGAYVLHQYMPRDEFRRHWTGYALTARPFAWGLWLRRSLAVLIVVVVGACSLVGLKSLTGVGAATQQVPLG